MAQKNVVVRCFTVLEQSLNEIFKSDFNLLESFYIDHQTPFDTTQNFYSVFLKNEEYIFNFSYHC